MLAQRFASEAPGYRQQISGLIKDQMSPSERTKLMTKDEMFNAFASDEEILEKEFTPKQMKEAFENTYGVADFYYDSSPYDIDITDAYSISNAFFDLADISTDAKNYYKSGLVNRKRSAEQAAPKTSGAAKFNPSN